MAKPKMHADYIKVVKQAQKKHPFSILPAQIPERAGTYAYPLRRTTVGTTVKLYQPILEALRMYTRTENTPLNTPFIMVSRPVLNGSGKVGYTYYLETVDEDGETLLICAGESRVRMTKVDANDPSIHSPLLPFNNQTGVQITAVTLALIPRILEIDEAKGNGKLSAVVAELGSELEDAENWTTENDIPELTKEHLYYTDAAMLVLNDTELDFGDPISSAPEEFDIEPFVGGVVCENLVNGWTPRFITGNGKAAKKVPKNVTIAMAKQQYSGFMAHRKWTPMEKMLIPSFPDDMPVMPEVLRMAERICRCKQDTNPVLNGMWRAPTSYGKSTGTRQLACILGIPFLDITCHTNMELQDFKSSFVPVSENGIELDMASVTMPKGEEDTTEGRPPFFDDAIAYVSAMDEQQRNALFDPRTFYSAVMVEDTEVLAETIIGSKKEISAEDLCWLYGEVRTAVMREEPLRKQVKQLKATAEVTPKEDNGNQPRFVHVVSNYIKAMVNGYLCEISEASRIRDPGVLVGLNGFDLPGAVLPLLNGGLARRHEDAICIITDNVGYASCRPIDPSVLRRMAFIMDTDELSKEQLLDRVRFNTGCTDQSILNTAYLYWKTVKEYCEQNSITEGSVSPMELERFVQALMHDGLDCLAEDLDDFVISKATSSVEDQRNIRTACQTAPAV